MHQGWTYPKVLGNRLVWRLWKRLFCKRGWHLWDEVSSEYHYLFCDACHTEAHLWDFNRHIERET
jgi:hypothetical protein